MAGGFTCKCYPPHVARIECEEKKSMDIHYSMTAKIALFSDTVSIFVGADNQVFKVLKEVLTLHSSYFKNRFDNMEEGEKLSLPNVQPRVFAEFVSWLYFAVYLDFNGNPYDYDTILAVQGWALGEQIGPPRYQNWCMDSIRGGVKCGMLDLQDAYVIYETTTKDSKLRKFAAHSITCESPFEQDVEGGKMYQAWNTLLEELPELAVDIALVAGKDWNGTYPWDYVHRQAYLVDEVDLGQRWEDQILAARSMEEIKAAAEGGCVRSIIESDHIGREKGSK